jgi:hypothetical protein
MRWLVLFLVLGASTARAEVVKFEVTSTQAAALEGRIFGQAGLAEKITGRATISLDPSDPRNAVIVDLSLAPRNAQGRVEAVTDVVIMRPQRPNGTLLFEVLNRGRKLMPGWTQDTDTNASIRLEQSTDAGNGFLLESGYTLVWAAWQADAPGAMRIDVPTISGVTGLSREEFTLPQGPGPHRIQLSYPVADPASIQFAVHGRADEPRLALGAPKLLDAITLEVMPAAGVAAGALYEVSYTARDSKMTGIGLAAIRDVSAFLRRDLSPMNPLAVDGRTSIDRAIGFGISQSGRVLRDFLYFGMNEDERGRLVFEGAMPIIPGARRSFTNARFAQPGRNPGPEFDRLYPVLQFPFTYPVLDDPLSGRRDGILQRCRLSDTCPRIMQMDSEFEFWGSQASLLITDPLGLPIDMPSDVRLYMLTGAPHANPWNAVAKRNLACELLVNPHNSGAALRALITNMQAWIADGIQPPASRYPQIGQGTLVPPSRAYPTIPGLGYRSQYVRANLVEQTEQGPVIKGEYPLFVPLAGSDGNAIGGIRMPIISAPRASYTGWNPHVGVHDAQELCTQLGGVLPLPSTAAEARAGGDPRPSLEDLYPTSEAYADAVRAVTAELVHARLMLTQDAVIALDSARSGSLAKLRK